MYQLKFWENSKIHRYLHIVIFKKQKKIPEKNLQLFHLSDHKFQVVQVNFS